MIEEPLTEDHLTHLSALKDGIIEILNALRETSGRLQKGEDVPSSTIQSLFNRGDILARNISAIPGMSEAGTEFQDHLDKIKKAIQDLKNFDALNKENLVTGVKF